MANQFIKRSGGLRPLPRLLAAGVLALPLVGCNTDRLVQVENPAALRPEDLNTASAIPALVNGARVQFVGGYSGFGDDAFLSASGVITDEMYWGDTFTTRVAADSRTVQASQLGNISDPAFARLQQARLNARRAYALVDKFTTSQTAAADAITKARLRAYEGYVFVTLSEGWCSAVPITRVPDIGTIDPTNLDYGSPLTAQQLNDTAVARFNEAIALNPADNLAKLGKARALLNLGRYSEAAAAVAAVPTTFAFYLEHSSNASSQNNPIYSLQSNGRYGISNLEGGVTATGAALRPDARDPATSAPGAEGIAFRGLRDPRVPWTARPPRGTCFSSSVLCWRNMNYPSFDADVTLASGVEAALIRAEAAFQAGDAAGMLSILDALRADAARLVKVLNRDQQQVFFGSSGAVELAPLSDPATATMTPEQQNAARRNLLFQERSLWLYNTGHRQGDLRRLVRNYGLPSDAVFPSGPYFRGGVYGNDVSYPVPFNEQNNPRYAEAIAQCNTTQA